MRKVILKIVPMGARRITHQGRFSESAKEYYAWKDELRLLARRHKVVVPASGMSLTFLVPTPKSWSKKKTAAALGQPKLSKPDIDNYLKAFLDVLAVGPAGDDSYVWHLRDLKKLWSTEGAIIIETED